MGAFCINKSGKQVKVYDSNTLSKAIGTLYNNECFAWVGAWAGDDSICQVCFRNKNGVLEYGYVLDLGDGTFTKYLNYSFGNVKVSGKTYKSFKTRMSLGFFDSDGNYKGACATGARVLTNDTTPGSGNPNLMRAMYVETGKSTNKWILISSIGGYGFIETGLELGSMSNTIGVYGKW